MTEDSEPALRAVEPGFQTLVRIQLLLTALPLALGALLVDQLVLRGNDLPWGFLSVFGVLLAVLLIFIVPARQYMHMRYAMDDAGLRVARGMMFRTDTIVPFVRVQHIDVGQGPVERMLGLAHLVVHTAGTHNSIVTLPGLRPDDAAAIRDTIRARIQTDFA